MPFIKMRKFFKARAPLGTIALEDGKTRSRSVMVREGVYTKVLGYKIAPAAA